MAPRFRETSHKPTAPELPLIKRMEEEEASPSLLCTTYPLNNSHSKILIVGLCESTFESSIRIFNNRGLRSGVNLSASEIRSLLTAETSAEIAEHFTSPQKKKTVTLSEKYDLVYGDINGNPIVSIISRKDALDAVHMGRASWDTLRHLGNVIDINLRRLALYYQNIPSWIMDFLSHMRSEDGVGEISHPNGQPLLESELVDVYMMLNDYTFHARARNVLQKHYLNLHEVMAGQFVSEMIALYPRKLMSMWISNICLNM